MAPDLPDVIDMHLHLSRDVEEEKHSKFRPGWADGWYWGNESHVVDYMDRRGVSHVVTLNLIDFRSVRAAKRAEAATAGKELDEQALNGEFQVEARAFNDWACGFYAREPRVIPFLFADPVVFGSGLVGEVERCLALGAQGVKLHPGVGGFFPDNPHLPDVFALCQERGVPVLTDTGGRVYDGRQPGAPRHWAPILREFPRMKLIVAHLPGELWDERIDLAREFGDNLWFDLAGGFVDDRHPRQSHRELPIEQGARLVRKVGIERILFGSDGPFGGIEILDSAAQVLQLDLSDDEKEALLAGNAREYFGLKG